jgi:hypothetical protein
LAGLQDDLAAPVRGCQESGRQLDQLGHSAATFALQPRDEGVDSAAVPLAAQEADLAVAPFRIHDTSWERIVAGATPGGQLLVSS